MKVEKIESFPAGANPFNHDLMRMGHTIGKDLMLMMSNHSGEECKSLVLVNTKTGERWKLTEFSEASTGDVKELEMVIST